MTAENPPIATLTPAPTTAVSNPIGLVWFGRVLSGLVTLLMVMGGVMKVMKLPMVTEGLGKFGYTPSFAFSLGICELVITALYVIPQTAVLGAILITGYLGGATEVNIRSGESWVGPVMVGVVTWLGLFFRDSRVRALAPFRQL